MSRDTVACVVGIPTRPRRSTSSSWVAIWCLAIRERIASCRLRFDIRERLPDACGRRSTYHVARSQRALQRQMVDDVRAEQRGKPLQLREAERFQAPVGGDCLGDHPADQGFFLLGIIELPLARASGSAAKENSTLVQSTISPQRRERWIIAMLHAASSSTTKSRSATESSEFALAAAKPRSRASSARSIGKPLPASAPAPRGEASARPSASANRLRSRRSIST